MKLFLCGIVALCGLLLHPAHGGTLISDPFTDGSRSNATGGDLLGAVWYQTTTDTGQVTIVDDSAGIGTGKAMQLVPSGDFHKLITFFGSTTLVNPGDTILATFDYRFPTAPTSSGGGMRIGIGNSAGTRQTSDVSGSTRGDDKNYGFDTNPGQTNSAGTGVRYEDAGDDILGGSGTGTRFAFGASGGSVASGTTKHSAALQITRLNNGDLFVQSQLDNLSPASGTHPAASVLTYTFDEFALGFGGTGYRPTILLDNVVVSSTSVNVLNIGATTPLASNYGPTPAVFTVTRSNTSGALNLPYTISGTAVNGVDYATLGGVVSFANGQASATITVTPPGVDVVEESKTVIITLSQPGGTVLQNATATVTIQDTASAWDGQLLPQYSELYTFYITATCGARLWIDDRLVVARNIAQSGEVRGQVQLTAGQRVNLRLEYVGQTIGSTISLDWASPSQPRQTIPQTQLSTGRVAKAGGSILLEHWTGIPGSAISALTSNANYPNTPNARELITSFECLAQNWADSYGTRVTGYIVPPISGGYTFAVSGDDTCQLSLSSDSTSANATLIASVTSATAFRQWNAQPSQQSGVVNLVQGQRYYVELLHKEDTGSDHWSVGWKKPGDTAFSVIPGSALVQAGLDRAQPPQASVFATLTQDHPRLFATPERFAWLKATYLSSTASVPKTWAASAIASANTIFGQPPVTYSLDSTGDILDVARTVKDRIYYLGLAWWLTGDNSYAERAWSELNTISDNTLFPDWNPPHFLDTAELTNASAVGYDWFYNYWTQARRDTLRTAIINKGLTAGLAQYTGNAGWSQIAGNNWNLVCNGGMTLGALAVATEDTTLTADILNRAMNSLRPVMAHFTTDAGAWYEGPGYWQYETEYGGRMLAGLESSLGSDFGLSSAPMFSETGLYSLAMTGTSGLAFNHSDSGTTSGGGHRVTEDTLEWHARRFNQPLAAWDENTYGSGVLAALWWQDQPTSVAASGLSPDMAFHGESGTGYKPAEVVTMRSNWADPQATCLGCKGGWMGADHGNFDAGSFVVDALGYRWFQDLGPDNYALAGYFNSTPNPTGVDRWDYYRTRGEGQNTIIVDPGSGPDMTYNTVAPLLAYQSSADGRRSMCVFDMTPVTNGVSRLWRGLQLMGNRNQVLVQDEIASSSPHTIWWFAHYSSPATAVVIDPDGSAATLTQGTSRLWVKIVSGGATFQIMNATPLPTSPNPSGQDPNTGYQKLAINLTNVTNTTLAVWMVPLSPGDTPPTTLPTITPLSAWNLAAVNDPPVTPNAAVTTSADQTVTIDLRNYATDDATYPSGLTFAVSGAVNGTVTLLVDGHTASFTPAPGYTGVPSFTYTATDVGGLSSSGTITISAAASDQIWSATTSGLWSAGANWSSAIAPISSRGNTIEFFTGQTLAANVTSTNDLGSFAMNVFNLSGTASAAANTVVTGNALTLTNNGTLNPVVNLSATTGSGLIYDVNVPLTLAASTTFQGSGTAVFRFNGDISGAGALTKSGSSTLILTGTGSYAGGTTISGGTLQIGNNTATGTLPGGTITDNTTLRFYRSDTALNVANAIVGTGVLTFGASSGGTLGAITTLSGTNSFAGNVTVVSGAVRITNSSALGTGTKTVTLSNGSNGAPGVRLNGSAGAIALPAAISFVTSNSDATNPALVNEAGNNSIAGNITLTSGGGDTRIRSDAGTLTLTGNIAPNMTNRNLLLAGAGAGTITGAISNGSPTNALVSVTKSDTGTWTLSGPITHTGTIVVNTGTLYLNGNVNGPSTVTTFSGAQLGGSGTIAANTTIFGTHSPGAGLGSQTFTGTLSYGSTSHLAWELAANTITGAGTNFDQVNAASVSVTTNAVIDPVFNSPGSTVNFADPFWAQNRTWPIVTSTGLTGAFKLGTVSADSAGNVAAGFGTFTVQNTATAASLVWTPAAPFQQWQAASFGANWNNVNIAGALADPDKDGLANLVEFAFGLNPNQENSALSLPQPQRLGGNYVVSFSQPSGVSGITYGAEWSSTLAGSWTPITDTGSGTTHIFSVPIGSNRQIFIHLKVSSP